jgi:hypothetical protein
MLFLSAVGSVFRHEFHRLTATNQFAGAFMLNSTMLPQISHL